MQPYGLSRTREVLEQVVGGEEEDRTPDLRIANATLSQLSYPPNDAAVYQIAARVRRPARARYRLHPNAQEHPWIRPTPLWLDTQYNNRARIPEHPQIFEHWRERSAAVRERRATRLDLAYGDGPNETLDLFPADAASAAAPVLVFIHGGWWRSLDKADHAFIAPAFTQAGAVVVVPNYALCPAVTIEAIALQMVRALAWTYRHVALHGGDPQRIVVAGALRGRSPGGHVDVLRLACRGRRSARRAGARCAGWCRGCSIWSRSAARRSCNPTCA